MTEQSHMGHESSAVQKHLEIMQGVINRMRKTAARARYGGVTLVAATLVLVAGPGAAARPDSVGPHAAIPVSDSYYLALERSFVSSQNAFVGKLHRDELELTDVFRVVPKGMGWRLVGRCLFGSVSIWPFYLLVTVTILLTWLLIIPSDTPLTGV